MEKFGDITLKRGKTDNKDFWDWIKEVQEGNIDSARRNGSIVMYDYALGEKARFNFLNGWPSKVNIGNLQAGGTEIAMEEVTIVHEGLEVRVTTAAVPREELGLKTEFGFELPQGYVDKSGMVHRSGTMRYGHGPRRDSSAP